MNTFRSKFVKLLEASDEDIERAAMESQLDQETDPTDFDMKDAPSGTAQDDPSVAVAQAHANMEQQMVNQLKEWIDRTTEFLEFLNSDTPQSIQTILSKAEPETIMDRVKQSQQTKIARCAAELAAFRESMLGFLAQSGNAHLKYVGFLLGGFLTFLSLPVVNQAFTYLV